MTGSKYLSELVDVTLFRQDKLNIIKAPTGSGKSYFALHTIPGLVRDAVHKVVYLIDTVNGKEQIVENYNATSEYHQWSQEVDQDGMWFEPDGRVVVLTYAKFGYLLNRYSNFYDHFSYIICDELHNLLRFQHFLPIPNIHSVARIGLENAVRNDKTIVIALTATPATISKEFHTPYIEIPVDQKQLIQYEVKEVIRYREIEDVLFQISPDSIGVCYLSRISQMEKFEAEARRQGFSPISIWSIRNADHPMTEEQLAARETILKECKIPSKYNLLIINSSSETSIKVKSTVDFVAIHSSNSDTQIQVRGRVNSDLNTIFLPGKQFPNLNVPDQFLGVKLFTEDKNKLLRILNLRNAHNRPYGWPTVKKYLLDNDYAILEDKEKRLHYAVITRSK